jgi:hypothetical protein
LEKANRDNAELADRLSGLELSTTQKLAQLEQERNEAIQERERWKMQAEQKWGMRRELEELLGVKDTQCDEQFAKGLAALRDLIQERDEARDLLTESKHSYRTVKFTESSKSVGDTPETDSCPAERIEGLCGQLERERDEAREDAKRATYDAAQETIKVSTVKSHWIEACRERDHYKEAIEEISVTIQDWLDSIVQEPSLDFIKAIKAWADKKLNPPFISK